MAKYQSLAAHLAVQSTSEVTLSFADVERIIGEELPPTADRFKPFWANSRAKDGHPGRFWMEQGWRQVKLDQANRLVTFRRLDARPTESLQSLEPVSKDTLYDLLHEAGVSIDGWNEGFKSNPNFCYEWCFGSVTEGFVLCLWYSEFKINEDGWIYFDRNARAGKEERARIANNLALDTNVRNRAKTQAQRAAALDVAIRESYERRLPVRVIVGAGKRPEGEERAERAAKVEKRYLDGQEWYVHSYDFFSGACVIVRGFEKPIDGNIDQTDEADGPYDEVQNRAIKTRRGQAKFRRALLDAYRTRCAVTGSRIEELLDAAHIVPHSLVTDYNVRNGLLLRTDIHTLFDLYILSVDSRSIVHVAPQLRLTDYGKYDGKSLAVVPDRFTDAPAADALDKHYSKYLELQRQKRQ
ncbi:HNH endonuclease [Paraburkholderia dipogonis]|uniref:HNH endonuclease n=1 Tax=Paraburkholderia dipogonis TaxID=1211383 RepID=A0A4Y8MJN2_9BURK|nr:HNH endonuclease signature motif containing protein [Paraburkholderia dipogonis]TFE37604.1 HNH endonuclease [Paraburkholderia dipogonis]